MDSERDDLNEIPENEELKMKRVLVLAAAAIFAGTVWAQGTDLERPPAEMVEIVLPAGAADCDVPKPPAAVVEEPTLEQLITAQGDVKAFQEEAIEYRECLEELRDDDGISEGNLTALNAAHDATVDMEEQVAERFNEEVREYKEDHPDE